MGEETVKIKGRIMSFENSRFIGRTDLVRVEFVMPEYIFVGLRVPSHKSGAFFGVADIDATIELLQKAKGYLENPETRADLPKATSCPTCETDIYVCCECDEEVSPGTTVAPVSWTEGDHLVCAECRSHSDEDNK